VTASHTYRVYLEPLEDGGFNAHIPAFPEVSAEGETEEEALASAAGQGRNVTPAQTP
jgi:predicted RNase H-like HicB family nuclease